MLHVKYENEQLTKLSSRKQRNNSSKKFVMTASKGLAQKSEDWKTIYNAFRTGKLDSLQYNAEDIRVKHDWTTKYEKKPFQTSVDRLVNQV